MSKKQNYETALLFEYNTYYILLGCFIVDFRSNDYRIQ